MLETDVLISSKRLYLRPLVVDDVTEAYLRWMNDADVNRCLESRFSRHSFDSLRAFVDAPERDPDTWLLAIVLRDGDRHVGNIKLGPIDGHHRRAEVGLLIGEKDCWGHGYASEVIRALTGFAFEELDLHKLTAGAYANNPGSARAFERAGWFREGVRRSHFRSDGTYVDYVLLGCLEPAEGAGKRQE